MPKFIVNLPNILTMFRLFTVPFVCLPLLPAFAPLTHAHFIIMFSFLIIGAISDYLDGFFARKWNQESEWGAYMDPLIDKILILFLYGTFVLIPYLKIPLWTISVIIFRDFAVTSMRNYAIHKDLEFKTSFFAKCKTAIQMIAGIMILGFLWYSWAKYSQSALMTDDNYLMIWKDNSLLFNIPRNTVMLTAIITGLSGLDYGITLLKQLSKKK